MPSRTPFPFRLDPALVLRLFQLGLLALSIVFFGGLVVIKHGRWKVLWKTPSKAISEVRVRRIAEVHLERSRHIYHGRWISAESPAGHPQATINLRQDGNFDFEAIPSGSIPSAQQGGLVSGSGQWKLERDLENITLHFENRSQFFDAHLLISTQDSGVELELPHILNGDPPLFFHKEDN